MSPVHVPQLPESAPFNVIQRQWLNGYLAALCPSLESPATAVAPKKRVLVMYASQSGNSENLAESFGEQLAAAGFDAPVMAADEEIDLTKEKTLLLIASTWGEGDPPDNAVDWWKALSVENHPRLEQLRFGVLALGDSNYLEFCGMGKKFDARLEALGATRFVERTDCDTDFEEPAEAWFASVLDSLGSDSKPTEATVAAPRKTIAYSKKNPFPALLRSNRLLNAANSERDTRHFELSIEGSGLSYEVGDVLGVFPNNDPTAVSELIDTLGLDSDALVPLPDGSGQTTLRDALIKHYDIGTVNRKLRDAWPSETPLSEDCDPHEVIDLAQACPATFADGEAFVKILRKLGPRLYSISSSPKAHPNEVHLTVAKVTYEIGGRPRKGVCSTYLSDRVNGDGTVRVFLQHVKHFKLPADLSTPVIMIGPGTGIAPFRAFLEERAATKAPGKNWLFFGNPHQATDWFYREELEAMQETKVLSRFSTAWSRDQDAKVYVQHRLREEGAELWQWLKNGAHVYVCGDAKRMAKDVEAALHAVIDEHGKVDATTYVAEMKKAKRYQRDVY